MDNFIKKHLQDIATAIDEIESFSMINPSYLKISAKTYVLDGQ